jgi:hypothetical protein
MNSPFEVTENADREEVSFKGTDFDNDKPKFAKKVEDKEDSAERA